MDKRDFLDIVQACIKEHPDWLGDVVDAGIRGVHLRLRVEEDMRCRAETAVMMCYDAAKAKLKGFARRAVEQTIAFSGSYGGSPLAVELLSKLKIPFDDAEERNGD